MIKLGVMVLKISFTGSFKINEIRIYFVEFLEIKRFPNNETLFIRQLTSTSFRQYDTAYDEAHSI